MASSRVSSAGSARARQPAGDVGSRLVGCREPELCGCVCVCDVTCTVCVCDVTLLCGVLPWRCVCTRARAACWLRVPALGATPSRRPAGAERGTRRVAGGMTARDAGRACQACRLEIVRIGADRGQLRLRCAPAPAAGSAPRPDVGVVKPSMLLRVQARGERKRKSNLRKKYSYRYRKRVATISRLATRERAVRSGAGSTWRGGVCGACGRGKRTENASATRRDAACTNRVFGLSRRRLLRLTCLVFGRFSFFYLLNVLYFK